MGSAAPERVAVGSGDVRLYLPKLGAKGVQCVCRSIVAQIVIEVVVHAGALRVGARTLHLAIPHQARRHGRRLRQDHLLVHRAATGANEP